MLCISLVIHGALGLIYLPYSLMGIYLHCSWNISIFMASHLKYIFLFSKLRFQLIQARYILILLKCALLQLTLKWSAFLFNVFLKPRFMFSISQQFSYWCLLTWSSSFPRTKSINATLNLDGHLLIKRVFLDLLKKLLMSLLLRLCFSSLELDC